jgi:hypothetical protein
MSARPSYGLTWVKVPLARRRSAMALVRKSRGSVAQRYSCKTRFARETSCTRWRPAVRTRVSGIRGPPESHEGFPVPADRVAVEHAGCSSLDTSPPRRNQTE